MKYGSKKFKSGEILEKNAVATWESWEPSQHSLIDKGNRRKPCAEVAGRRIFRILTSSQNLATKPAIRQLSQQSGKWAGNPATKLAIRQLSQQSGN
jgi:hypothetical protein